ncbi:SseB family protein [Aureivirga sp. CE67]|uniref:SseB family protein n=1 Tax=Aureivirga sp. CE67 TaxID=1788983 RepID=UPI0018CB7DCC|nr:SseB family protein [Aureivirga sp. CE67]
MKLFDIFKKKKKQTTFPENDLEICLQQAFERNSAQKEFYMKLLWSELVALKVDDEKENQADENGKFSLKLIRFENGTIPIFTSTNRIYDGNEKHPNDTTIIGMEAQALLEITKGHTLILNPFSEISKELIPQEIEDLINGKMFEKDEEFNLDRFEMYEFNEIFDRAADRQKNLIILGVHNSNGYLSKADYAKLEESIEDFKRCLDMIPEHWQSMVLMAKAYQKIGEHENALEALEKAFLIEKEDHTIPMEASTEAMHMNDNEKAIFYAEEALKRKPNDAALSGNYALNLFLAKRDDEAVQTIEEALRLDPKDRVNQNIQVIINDVVSGKKERPNFKDLV